MNKNERRFWIERMDRQKFSDTKPERAARKILDVVAPNSTIFDHLKLKFPDFTITPDFIIHPNTAIEVDGDYHKTAIQEKKTRWRDALLNKRGFRVIHIDAGLCVPQWEDYLIKALRTAIQNGNPTTTIYA